MRFCGGVWTVVYKENGKLHLTSLDGKQHKRNIHESQVQLIDQFARTVIRRNRRRTCEIAGIKQRFD